MSIEFEPGAELLTIAEAAHFLTISVSSMRRLQQRRSVPFFKVGGSVRFSKIDLTAYLNGRRVDEIDQK